MKLWHVVSLSMLAVISAGRAFADCASNPICAENQQTTGVTTRPDWDIYPGYEDPNLVGFASPLSIDRSVPNNTLQLKIKSQYPFTVSIFRLGYYGGAGARLITVLNSGNTFPANAQSPCAWPSDGHETVDCSAWSGIPYTHNPSIPSGIYLARLLSYKPSGAFVGGRLVPFIVRDDSRQSDVLAMTPDLTWEAYNLWTDSPARTMVNSSITSIGAFYTPTAEGGVVTDASYNRPFTGSALKYSNGLSYDTPYGFNTSARPSFFYNDIYTIVRYLERNGINVSYITGQKVAQDYSTPMQSSLLLPAVPGKPRVFMTMGHDEYWSQEQRNNVERARSQGVHFAFLTGNDMFWHVTWTDANTIHCEKESNKTPMVGSVQSTFTGMFADGRYLPGADYPTAAGAANATTGLLPIGEDNYASTLVSPEEGALRFWRGTVFASGGTQQYLMSSFPNYLEIGHEWDEDVDNGYRRSGIIHLSTTPIFGGSLNVGYGDGTIGNMMTTHHMVMFRDPTTGSITYHAGSLSIGRLLDTFSSDQTEKFTVSPAMASYQQAMLNLFADMGLPQPDSLTDGSWSPPPSSIPTPSVQLNPPPASPIPVMNHTVILTGTAAGGNGANVGSVEVMVTDPANPQPTERWIKAYGHENWRFEWVPPYPSTFTIRARAINDFGAMADSDPIQVTVEGVARIYHGDYQYPINQQPTNPLTPWVGTEFQTDAPGTVIGAKIYSLSGNPYPVALVNMSNGQILAETTLSTSGGNWKSATFPSPVAIGAGRTYALVFQASHEDGFAYVPGGLSSPHVAAPLHALSGVFTYNAQPNVLTPWNADYGVDVLFAPSGYYSSAQQYPSIYGSVVPPQFQAATAEVDVGTHFIPISDGFIDGVSFYESDQDPGPHYVSLWQMNLYGNTLLKSTVSTESATGGVVKALFAVPVRAIAGKEYMVTLHSATGFAFGTTPLASPGPMFSDIYPVYMYTNRGIYGFSNCTEWDTCSTVSFASAGYYYNVDPLFRPTAAFRQSLWPRSGVNPMDAHRGQSPGFSLGTVFSAGVAGYIKVVRFFDQNSESSTVSIYGPAPGHSLLCQATAVGTPTGNGWQSVSFATPCQIAAGVKYTVAVSTASGSYAWSDGMFESSSTPISMSPLDGVLMGWGGYYSPSGGVPTFSYTPGSSYFVDVVFTTTP